MRTDLELLKLMVKHKDKFKGGIMGWLRGLLHANLINKEEYYHLGAYMTEPVKEWRNKLTADEYDDFNEYGNLLPRLKFIKHEITKLSKK